MPAGIKGPCDTETEGGVLDSGSAPADIRAGCKFTGLLPMLADEIPTGIIPELIVSELARAGGAKTDNSKGGAEVLGRTGNGEATTVLKPDGNAEGGDRTHIRTTIKIKIAKLLNVHSYLFP